MKYDIAIIGAGIVGLATALKIKEKSPDKKVLIIDKENDVAAHQTGHNSGVIHSGLYYKPGSLKATNCITGYKMLVDFCEKNEVPYDICGKVVVATSKEEIPVLNGLFTRGIANGLDGLKMLDKDEIKEYEPHVAGLEGFWVPQTGIVDYSVVSQKMKTLLKQTDTIFALGSKVTNIKITSTEVNIIAGGEEYQSAQLINCAGLHSDKIAEMTGDNPGIKIIPFRGEYYTLKPEKEYLVKNLVYPVPDVELPFLGVHFTRMQRGGVEAGPNAVLAYKREGYKKTDISLPELFETLAWPGFQKVIKSFWKMGMGEFYRSYSKSAFTKALQKLIPEIVADDLVKGASGVRAQACDRDGGLLDDFLIHQTDRVINVLNAPSPAATSALSIGESVAALALK
ncbi:MAG: L-2-hydroxyglutarate oxidase [Bacteroidetes bacterium]|nr:MAG: L-2-hydroxyglutarate oxidase [Bacteroidota bacterium]